MPERLLQDIADIAREAGQLAQRRAAEGFKSWEKSPGNPVCDADLEVNELLHRRLTALDPDAGWLSEETADDMTRLAKRRLWVVDPIDGTRDYIRGRPGWAVSIAMIVDDTPLAAVLDAPARGEHWRALHGRGATCNGMSVSVSGRSVFSGARVPADHLPQVDADLVMVPRPNSIALRMAIVAAGDADLVATLRWSNEWDIAAAALIVTEAGGAITDAQGQPIRFNADPPRAFGLIAATPAIHADAVNRLRQRAADAFAQSRSSGSGSSPP